MYLALVRHKCKRLLKTFRCRILWSCSQINSINGQIYKRKVIEISKEVLNIDPNYFSLTEVDLLVGDTAKAYEKLGWKAQIHLEELIQEMVLLGLNEIKE